MKPRVTLLAVLTTAALIISVCNGSVETAQTPVGVTPTSVADDGIVAEGRVEPAHYAKIAFTIAGTVSDVLVAEGQAVKKGQPLIRLDDELDTNYAAAQLELVNAEKAVNDLKKTLPILTWHKPSLI